MKFLILIIELLFIVNYVNSKLKSNNLPDTPLARYGSNMSRCMERKANPCDDFYRFSCGNWRTFNKIISDEEEITEKGVLNGIYIQQLHEILNAGETFPMDETTKLAKNYYLSCTETDIIEKRDVIPIKDFIRRQGGMPFIHSEWKDSTFNFTETLINLKKTYNIDILIGLHFSNDYRNPKNRILYVGETPLSPIPRNYYFESKHKSQVEKYRSRMSKFLQKLGIDWERSEALSKKFLAFERDILKGIMVDSNTALRPLTIKKLTREHFASTDNKFIDFDVYIKKVLGFTIPDTSEVIEANHYYIKSVLEVIDRTSNRDLANYVMYKVAEIFMYKNFDRNGKLIKGTKRIPYCVRQTMKFFPKITSQIYYEKYQNLAARSDLFLIYRHLKRVILTYNPSKRSEIENIKIDFLKFEKRELQEQINGIDISQEEYYKNTENMMKLYANRWATKFHSKKIDRSDIVKPLDINAYYYSIDKENHIQVPVTAFQAPFYSSKYPKAINFARLGVYLARALTNVFPNFSQSKYAYEQEFLHDWWKHGDDFNSANNIGIVADEKIKCFQNQIQYTQLAELISEDESFAVSFGVKASFLAYLDYLAQFKPNEKIDLEILENETLFGLDLTNTQLFFVTYAQNWCKAGKKKDEKLKIFPSLANFDEFSKEFRCTEGSWMRPKQMCSGYL